jgi:arabinofuranan 3-O-arabinosyltransferase
VSVTLAELVDDWGRFASDTRIDLYLRPRAALAESMSAWVASPFGAGRPNFGTGVAPVAALVTGLAEVGIPAWLIVRVLRICLYLVAAAGVARLVRALLPTVRPAAGIVAAALYVANPYSIVAGATLPALQPFAFLPWLVLAFWRALETPARWRWPALAGLAFFAMGGLNAGVIPLFSVVALPCVALWAVRWRGIAGSAAIGALIRTAVVAAGVSVYWVLPAVAASASGAAVVAATESAYDVARTSSYAEVLRGLGLWPMYGRSGDRVWQPGFTDYVVEPLVVVCSFGLPLLAALAAWRARSTVRALGVVLMASAIPVMVGLFPPSSPTPLGRALAWVFDAVPATSAFRTTNKIGAVAMLGLVLLVAAGLAEGVGARSRRTVAALAVLATVVQVLAVKPAWSGGLHPDSFEVPAYWRAAGTALDDAGDGRVFVVPGGQGSNYRWGLRAPDEIMTSVMDRPAVVHTSVLTGAAAPANLLAAIDGALQHGSLPPGGLSTAARYLGADEILLRSDQRWEEQAGARPAELVAALDADPGLALTAAYGDPGEFTTLDAAGPGDADAAVEPLRRYAAMTPGEQARAVSAAATVLIAGDGFAVPTLAQAGLLRGAPPIRYVGDTDVEALRQLLADGVRLAITDTNRRRAWGANQVTTPFSETLRADQPLDRGSAPSLTLWPDDASAQTVVLLEGARTIEASPAVFGERPSNRPGFAFDGDPSTSWLSGYLGTATGAWIEIALIAPIDGGTVTIDLAEAGGPDVTRLSVEAGTGTLSVPVLPGSDDVVLELPDVPVDRVRVTFEEVQGDSLAPVGIDEVAIDGVSVRETVRLPTRLNDLAALLDESSLRQLDGAPLTVTLQAQIGDPSTFVDDEERAIDRTFAIPTDRTFRVSAAVLAPDVLPPAVMADLDDDGCATFAYLDGRPIEMRLAPAAAAPPGTVAAVPCDRAPLPLAAGVHRLQSASGWLVHSVEFVSTDDAVRPVPRPVGATSTRTSATEFHIRVGSSDQPRLVIVHEGFDARWQATVGGDSLGPPAIVDGYALGWRLDAGEAVDVVVTYPPQRVLQLSMLLSAAAVVAASFAAVLGGRRRPAHKRRRWR